MFLSDQPPALPPREDFENSLLPVKYYLQIKDLQSREEIMECLSILIMNSADIGIEILRELEDNGVSLGNGAFVLIKIKFRGLFFPFDQDKNPFIPPDGFAKPQQENAEKVHIMVQKILRGLCKTVFFSHGGDMYALCCMQGEDSEDPEHYTAFFGQLKFRISQISDYAANQRIPIRFLVSEAYLTAKKISKTYRDIQILEEYSNFLPQAPNVMMLWDYRAEKDRTRAFLHVKETVIPQLVLRVRDIAPKEIDALARTMANYMVGAYPAPKLRLQLESNELFRDFNRILLERGIVDASFVKQHDPAALCEAFYDLDSLVRILSGLIQDAKACHHEISVRIFSEKLVAVCDYIDQNIADPNLSVTYIADHFQVSRTTLSTKFQRHFGISMTKYIQNQRMQLARRLLTENPSLPLNEIAQQSGFSSVSTLYRAFMQVEKCSPGSFRVKSGKEVHDDE